MRCVVAGTYCPIEHVQPQRAAATSGASQGRKPPLGRMARLFQERGGNEESAVKIKTMAAAVAALGLTFQAGAAAADEGMWTFDNFPSALVKQKYGVNADQAWLDHVRGGPARIPGCSASIVSGQRLVLTNYHCFATCVQNLSSAAKDYLMDGFGVGMADERKCPGMWLEALQSIKDVTAEVM